MAIKSKGISMERCNYSILRRPNYIFIFDGHPHPQTELGPTCFCGGPTKIFLTITNPIETIRNCYIKFNRI